MGRYPDRIPLDKQNTLIYNKHLTTQPQELQMEMLVGINHHSDVVVMYDEETLLNQNYWDCDCSHDYIQPVIKHHCEECGADRDDSEISHEVEVLQLVYKELSQ